MSFVHLHVHTQYSLLDGFSSIEKLVTRAKEYGMPAVAMTDHGNLFGAVDFFNKAKAAGIKPIIGLESYMAARSLSDRDAKLDRTSSHVLLLAENQAGYQNLLTLASVAQLEGFYYYPRIDHELLARHSDGLIATSGCMSAEIPRLIQSGETEAAEARLKWYLDVFGADRFFVELQPHDIPELHAQNKILTALARKYGLRLLATNDVHYVDKDDAASQDVLLAIQTGKKLSDPDRMRMDGVGYYLRSPDEMKHLFASHPDALENTLLIAERCSVDLSRKKYWIPEFPVAEGHTVETYLRALCEDGLRQRYGERCCAEDVQKRLEYELGVIHRMGFDSYFLIVWDLTQFAQREGIWYNARGSAAGSIAAYALGITSVDPLAFGLIFERFLNPDRISMPDIDLDFQDDRRARMMEYCVEKYGIDHVSQIITFGTLAARGAVRDVGRVLGVPLPDVDRIAKLIPNIPGNPVTIAEAIETVPELGRAHRDDPEVRNLLDMAARLEGAYRNAGTHAAGVIICPDPIQQHAPLHRPTSDAEDVPIKRLCQFDMSSAEALGLLKVDFLGLSTLTIMQRACDLIEARHGVRLDLKNIPTDDPAAFELLGAGSTIGIFQVEGAGLRTYLREMKPRELANIIAMIALYRPGPIEFIPSYIKRMHGQEEVAYRHPSLEPIFKETYGIPVYQEDLMFAAMQIGGYTASEADELRKAISKKQKEKLKKHREKFISGATANGLEPETAEAIFSDWENFARYGFNRAHAADYGVISVQTAYLKAHYPVEYMAALMAVCQGNVDKIKVYAADGRRLGIRLLPPDVNRSGLDFSIEDGENGSAIRFGLGALKNVGNGPVELILAAREGGEFTSLLDFARRVDLKAVGRRALESLVKAGALDGFGGRKGIIWMLDKVISRSKPARKGGPEQILLFSDDVAAGPLEAPPADPKTDLSLYLEWERDLLGLYISDHPLSIYQKQLDRVVSHYADEIGEDLNGKKVTLAGVILSVRDHSTKKGAPMAFAVLEDFQGSIQLVVFPKVWNRYRDLLQAGTPVVVQGSVDASGSRDPQILVDQLADIRNLPPADEPPAPEAEARLEEGPGMPAGMDETQADEVRDPYQPAPETDPLRSRQEEPGSAPAPLIPFSTSGSSAAAVSPGSPVDLLPPEPPDDLLPPDVLPGGKPPVRHQQESRQPPARQPVRQPSRAAVAPQPGPQAGQPDRYPALPQHVLIQSPNGENNAQKRHLSVTLLQTEDKVRDRLRVHSIYGIISSYPGDDSFDFLVEDRRSRKRFLIHFPSIGVGVCNEMLQRVVAKVGADNVSVTTIHLQ